ncbi:MAG: class I SAM-dependent methyltransferase [Thermodesulfobacteriota bacterium]
MIRNKIKKAIDFYNDQYTGKAYAEGEFHGDESSLVQSLLKECGSRRPRILEIGCGRGHLQNVTEDYVGCDLSVVAGGYFKKPFVVGSAENLPFQDESFDFVMSFTVLEHIIHPEMALSEMVRVLRKGGRLVVGAAWRVPPWRPLALEKRPFANLSILEKSLKLILPAINCLWTNGILRIPIRSLRELRFFFLKRLICLPFTRMNPNWEEFLIPDSDAASSIDNHACVLWLHSKGLYNNLARRPLQRIFLRCGPVVMLKP